jgi:hypothetical protein
MRCSSRGGGARIAIPVFRAYTATALTSLLYPDIIDAGRRTLMPRPPAELRRIEEEERRRARAHRRLAWERRRRLALWVAAGLVAAAALMSLARLAGLPVG